MIASETARQQGTQAAITSRVRRAWIGIVLFFTVLVIVSLGRGVFNYNTETDFLGGFVPEAMRFLEGDALRIDFHPPLYPMSIALVYAALGDWFASGIALSLLASLAVMAMSLVYLRTSLGEGAAIGGVVALVISPTFVYYSLQATSELFSLALYIGAFLAVSVSARQRSALTYLVAGFVLGLALLTRTNHIVLLGLLLFYLVPMPSDSRRRSAQTVFKALGTVVLGIGLPLLIWSVYATSTGAPVMPTKNHENLALTYFSPDDRISGEARFVLAQQFTSTLEVLTADPARILRIYARDFVVTSHRLLLRDTVLPVPLIGLSLLLWLLLWFRERDRRAWIVVLFLNLVAMYVLLNFKAYEHRYYLYLLPFFGASIGYVFEKAMRAVGSAAVRISCLLVLTLVLGYGVSFGINESRRLHFSDWATDAYVAAQQLPAPDVGESHALFARKPHVAFYADARSAWMPHLETLEAFIEYLSVFERFASRQVFVFYGADERARRPQYAALAHPEGAGLSAGLELVATGPERDGWFLYRFERQDDSVGPLLDGTRPAGSLSMLRVGVKVP